MITKIRRRLLFFFCCAFAGFLVFHFYHQDRCLFNKIHQIPIEDRWAIESFFKILLFQEDAAYVLFGDKPVTYTGYLDFSNKEIFSFFRRRSNLVNKQLRQGWEIWEKYAHLFPSRRYILKGKRSDWRRVEIVLIDKKKFKKKFEENRSDFQEVLGNEITASYLLKSYENDSLPLFDHLKEHHALLGILLGYGKRNAWLFYFRVRDNENSPEEWEYYRKILTGSFPEKNHGKPYKSFYLPMFVVDPNSQETKELREKFIHERAEIQAIYAHGNFLEITLKRLCS